MASMKQYEEKILFSSVLYPPHEVELGEIKKTRRRRKKARVDDGSGAESKKRKLNQEQAKFLEMNFGKERKLESGRKMSLAGELGLDPKQVAVWFQNRRARWKNKQLEEEFMRLKSQHDAVVVEKCHLENEVLNVKTRLAEAEEKIKMLSGGGRSSDEGIISPSSSSTETYQHPTFCGGLDDFLYLNEQYNYLDYGFYLGM